MNALDLSQPVADALRHVGVHSRVPLEVVGADLADGLVHIELVLRYLRDRPVCCDEPGCYVPFLGLKRREVPAALALSLGLPIAPKVSMLVHGRHEPGYRPIDHATGRLLEAGADFSAHYPPEHFAAV